MSFNWPRRETERPRTPLDIAGLPPRTARRQYTVWKNPATGKVSPVPRHQEIKEVIVKSICRQWIIAAPAK
jgi:hypothetical protein